MIFGFRQFILYVLISGTRSFVLNLYINVLQLKLIEGTTRQNTGIVVGFSIGTTHRIIWLWTTNAAMYPASHPQASEQKY